MRKKKKLELFSEMYAMFIFIFLIPLCFHFHCENITSFHHIPSSWCLQSWVLYFTFLLQCFEKKESLLCHSSPFAAPDYILSFSILFPHGCFLNLLMFSTVLSLCLLYPHVFFSFLFCTPYLCKKVTGILNFITAFRISITMLI